MISVSRGANVVHACPVMILCDPTSAVTTVPAGAAARTVSTSSDGFSRPAAYPAWYAARSAARCAASSASDQRGPSPQLARNHASAAATLPTTSTAAG